MGFTLKPDFLKTAAKAADVQKKMKADLKGNVGRRDVKFVAAKNCVIGGKTISLFIVTDTPALFEAVIKTNHPKAYRAKGTCDLLKDKDGKTTVTIKTSSGQMLADAVAKMVPVAVASDKNVVAYTQQTAPLTSDALKNAPLKRTVKFDTGGVAKWAREKYKRQAKRTIMASMTPDGKIGSVYFGKDGRIRTTHSAGPEQEKHSGQNILQFNVNEEVAIPEFEKANPTLVNSPDYWDHFDQWLVKKLKNVGVKSTPSWATLLTDPDTAHDTSTGAPPENLKLFEIFKDINGDVESWHPSRGTGTKFETDKQTVAVLQAAIVHINKESPLPKPLPQDEGAKKRLYSQRNVKFYDFVKSRLPQSAIVKAMRRPEEID